MINYMNKKIGNKHGATQIGEIVSRLKQYSAYEIWQQLPELLSKFYWKKHYLWTRGYFVASIGEASESTIRRYIENQG